MPDATGLELIAQELREAHGADPSSGPPVLDTVFFRGRGTLVIEPERVRRVLGELRERGYAFLASVHGVDYYPRRAAPRRASTSCSTCTVWTASPSRCRSTRADPRVDSVTPEWPTADHQEREVYDMFGVVFEGHPDLRRILMPEDYEGHPQRRDFPIGGEPVVFTYNENEALGSPE